MYEPDPRDPLIATLIGEYLELGMENTTPRRRQYITTIVSAFSRAFGTWKVKDLKPLAYKQWMKNQTNYRCNHTRSNVTKILKAVFNFAIRNDRIDRNPLAFVSYHAPETRRPMTDAEFRLLLRLADGGFRRVLLFLRETGARPGELCSAQWRHWDRERNVLILTKHKTAHLAGKPRIIILTPVLIRLLHWLELRRPTRLYIEAVRRATGVEPPPLPNQDDEFIFLNRRGRPWIISNLDQRVARLRERCGIDTSLKLYGLRHRYGTNLVTENVNLHTVATLMGHENVATTSRHYLHIQGDIDMLRAAAEKAMRKDKPGKDGGA
jgi:integrase